MTWGPNTRWGEAPPVPSSPKSKEVVPLLPTPTRAAKSLSQRAVSPEQGAARVPCPSGHRGVCTATGCAADALVDLSRGSLILSIDRRRRSDSKPSLGMWPRSATVQGAQLFMALTKNPGIQVPGWLNRSPHVLATGSKRLVLQGHCQLALHYRTCRGSTKGTITRGPCCNHSNTAKC